MRIVGCWAAGSGKVASNWRGVLNFKVERLKTTRDLGRERRGPTTNFQSVAGPLNPIPLVMTTELSVHCHAIALSS